MVRLEFRFHLPLVIGTIHVFVNRTTREAVVMATGIAEERVDIIFKSTPARAVGSGAVVAVWSPAFSLLYAALKILLICVRTNQLKQTQNMPLQF